MFAGMALRLENGVAVFSSSVDILSGSQAVAVSSNGEYGDRGFQQTNRTWSPYLVAYLIAYLVVYLVVYLVAYLVAYLMVLFACWKR